MGIILWYSNHLPDMLSSLPGRSKWVLMAVGFPSCIGLPRILGGSASTTVLLGPSQGSLAFRPSRLLQSFRLTSVPEASAGRPPFPTVQVATGMNRQFHGRELHPLVICAFVAHQILWSVGFFSWVVFNSSYTFNAPVLRRRNAVRCNRLLAGYSPIH